MHVLPALRDMGFGGVNLTVPLKEVAFAHLQNLDESAQLLGAVNTVAFTPQGLRGYNTDGYGFLRAVDEAFGPSIRGQSVFVLGTGGAGRAVALVCAEQGAAAIALADIDRNRAVRVADEISVRSPETTVSVVDQEIWVDSARAANLIIQSTPVGMQAEDPVLLPPTAFGPDQKVFDLIYMFPETPLLARARAAGAVVANGLGMLLHQGARAFTLWTGDQPDVAAMRQALEKAVYG